MRIEDLHQLQNLDREIQRDRERLRRLETGDRWEAAGLREQIEAGIRRRMGLRARLVAYIDAIPDSVTRDIFKLKYLDGRTWRQIAAEMHLSAEACKKRHGKQLKQDL